MTLSPAEMRRVYDIQRQLHQKFRDVPENGKLVDYLGAQFWVYHGVFWPSWDSQALVKNYVVNPGEEVCDVCTGSGVIAIYSASLGAKKVVALDINPNAIRATKENASFHGLSKVIEARESDVFSALREDERFDVVTMNSPMTQHSGERGDYAERTTWDVDFKVHMNFFAKLGRVLKQHDSARAYITQSNFGAIEAMEALAETAGYSVKEIGKTVVDDLRTFYAFELRRKGRA